MVDFKVVAVAGGFDPFHQGHYFHILKASMLGNHLLVMVSNDDDMIRKKGKCNIPLYWRITFVKAMLNWMGVRGDVVPTLDDDGTQAKTIRYYKPNIFAKGGDRTPDNMPQNEIEACESVGCEIVYYVGEQLSESSKMQ